VTSSAAFELVDVSKRYGARWALSRVTFSLPRGGALMLTGHNGSGKTTLLRMLATATFPNMGTLKVLGRDTREARMDLRREVGLLSHVSYLYEDLTAAQNLSMLSRLANLGSSKTDIEGLLDRVGLSQRRDHPVRQFSAGMRKRLAIARLLLKAPQLALLDEPFGELDPKGILEMEELIRALQTKGSTLVLATHLIEQGLALTTSRLHLENGFITEPPK
jgi:heme exporter protein A